MRNKFTLEYWKDEEWYVGRLQEVPGVFSQGQTLTELEENIQDAYSLVMKEQVHIRKPAHSKPTFVSL